MAELASSLALVEMGTTLGKILRAPYTVWCFLKSWCDGAEDAAQRDGDQYSQPDKSRPLNQEIADNLTITVGTAKWHLRRIFDKLSVRNHTAAAARAREQRLL